uniref:Uncharacterized protein n=1 Tax=Tanacetum cinerariifolium TaxID=118510 RepID=A0A699J128_TANCI|nr:hypothetical protein [Tanacetum cinerariifolium]
MAESSSPDITPKEEPVTLDRPESLNPFLPAIRAEFTFKEIAFTTNNEEDLIHKLNKKTREKIVPCLRFISLILKHMAPKYDNEELTINPTQVFSVHNWILKPNQPKEPPFTDHMKSICNLDVYVDSRAPKYSSPTEEVKDIKEKDKIRAKTGQNQKQTESVEKSKVNRKSNPTNSKPPSLKSQKKLKMRGLM